MRFYLLDCSIVSNVSHVSCFPCTILMSLLYDIKDVRQFVDNFFFYLLTDIGWCVVYQIYRCVWDIDRSKIDTEDGDWYRDRIQYNSNRWNAHNLFPILSFIHLIIFFLFPTLFQVYSNANNLRLYFSHTIFFSSFIRSLTLSIASFRLRIVTANKYLWEEESSGREKDKATIYSNNKLRSN